MAQDPFAAFLVCMSLSQPPAEASQKATAYLGSVRALVSLVSGGLFVGILDYSKLTLNDGLMMRAVGGDQPGDYRVRNGFRAWVENLKPILAT